MPPMEIAGRECRRRHSAQTDWDGSCAVEQETQRIIATTQVNRVNVCLYLH